ncbi:MAG: excinuclease ABC subunit B, partial [Clostridium sp.]|nr:excinuclease ABC subunit B [Clostridium sp.]
MLCQKCKKNQANVHLVKLVNGEKSDVWLCEECARKISDISLGIPMNNTNINSDSFQNILSGFFDS